MNLKASPKYGKYRIRYDLVMCPMCERFHGQIGDDSIDPNVPVSQLPYTKIEARRISLNYSIMRTEEKYRHDS